MTMSIGPKAHRVKFLTAFHRVSCTHTPSKSAFTTAAKALNQVRPSKQISRPSIVARAPPPQHLAPATTILRYASTAPAAPNQNQPSTSEEVLTWDRFFDLRRKRRYLNLGSSVITASTAIGIFGPLIAQQDIDGWAAQISGIDPIIVLGITTFATAAGGWLCGPSFGTAMFKVWAGRKGWNQAIQEVRRRTTIRIIE